LAIAGAGVEEMETVAKAWGAEFAQEHGLRIDYISVGMGNGIERLAQGRTNFALTDIPLTQADLIYSNLLQYPLAHDAVIPVANVATSSDQLRMSGRVLAQVFLGKITFWDAPELRELNPGTVLPHLSIRVLHRLDTSGTTFVFTYYLSKTSAEWEHAVGIGARVDWPSGDGVRGDDGMAEGLERTAGSIGYIRSGATNHVPLTQISLRNHEGSFITANAASIRAGASAERFARWSRYEVLVDEPGRESWPIVNTYFILVARYPKDPREIADFIRAIYGAPQLVAGKNLVPVSGARIVESIDETRVPQGQH